MLLEERKSDFLYFVFSAMYGLSSIVDFSFSSDFYNTKIYMHC